MEKNLTVLNYHLEEISFLCQPTVFIEDNILFQGQSGAAFGGLINPKSLP
jgi:hypothetical protein